MNHTEINKTLSDSRNPLNKNHSPSDGPDKFTALIRRMNESELAKSNCVWMNTKDIEQYFPCERNGTAVFARIANRVYKIVEKSWVNPGEIGLNFVQVDEIETVINKDDTVVVTPYISDPSYQQDLTKARFSLQPQISLHEEDEPPINQNILDIEDVKKYFLNHYAGHIFKEGESILCNFNNRAFFATFISGDSDHKPSNKDYFSVIKQTTDLFFESVDWAPYVLSKKTLPKDPPTFKFNVELSGIEDYPDATRPIIYDVDDFEYKVMKALRNKWLVPGMFVEYSIAKGVDIKVTLRETSLPKQPIELTAKEESYVKAYQLTDDAKLEFVTDNSDICAVKGKPHKPKRVTFKISMLDVTQGSDDLQDHIRNWINVAELKKAVRKEIEEFSSETKFYVDYQGYRFTLEIYAVDNEDLIDRDSVYMKHWRLADDTRLRFTINNNIDLNLIPNEKMHSLEKIKLQIHPKTTKKTEGIIEVDEEKLENALRKFLPKERCIGQKFTIDLENGQVFDVKVMDLGFKEKKYNSRIYPHLGKIVSDTHFDLKYSIYHMQLVHPPNIVYFKNDNPKEAMEELGLTGLSDHIIETIETLVYPLGELRDWAEKINIHPPKGLLLYGPPGTGKTTFAHGLGKLLGISKTNISEVSAKDIHDKWVGNSEKNIHKLFAPAIKAAQNGSNERFIVFIDEIESLCANRRESTSSYKKDIVGALLAEMDGFNKLTNVMVIGTTNDLPRIDPAFLRPGRFSHILEFPLPDKAGRKKILEYHAKDLVENDYIENDIDFGYYAEQTEGCSGDHLKGLIMDAKHYNLRRLAKLKLKANEVEEHPDRKISKEDFKLAFAKLKKTRQKESDTPPPDGMYT